MGKTANKKAIGLIGLIVIVIALTALCAVAVCRADKPQAAETGVTAIAAAHGGVKQVCSGEGFSMLLMNDGTLYSSGANDYGQLGLGDTQNRTVFTKVTMPDNKQVDEIFSGDGNYMMAMTTDGVLYGVGDNGSATLGLGENVGSVNEFTVVPGFSAGEIRTVVAKAHVAYVVKNDGTVFVAGSDDSPYGLGGFQIESSYVYTYTKIPELTNVKYIDCSDGIIAITEDNKIFMYGYFYNAFGNVQFDSFMDASSRFSLPAGETVTSLYAPFGNMYICTSANKVYNLVSGTFTEIPALTGKNIVSFTGESTALLAVSSDGLVYAAGNNSYNQFGEHATTGDFTQIEGIANVVSVTNGYYASLIATSDNKLYVAGHNNSGKFGLGDTTHRTTWTNAIRYTVHFEANGGSGTMANQTPDCGTETPLTANTFVAPDGYDFAGWATESGGAKVYDDTAAVTDLAEFTETATLFALWKLASPSVSIEASAASVKYGDSITLTAKVTEIANINYAYRWLKDGAEITGQTATTLTLSNIDDTGSYTVEVTASTDNETATATSDAAAITIEKADYNMNGASWDYTDAFTYDGTEKTVAVTGLLPTGVEVAGYVGNTGTDAKDYTASVTFTYDDTHYNAPVLADLNWKINKADYDMNGVSWDYTDAFTYDGAAKTVKVTGLPTGVTVAEYVGNSGTEAKEYTASVTFAYDETNYNAPVLANLNWKINKADYDMTGASWNYTDAFTYDGTEKTVEVSGLPLGVTVAEYAGNTGTNASDYTASVTFAYDETNYNAPVLANLDWKIEKATVTPPTIEAKAYTGAPLTADVAENELYTVKTNEGGTGKGAYDVVLELIDAANYKWADGVATSGVDNEWATVKFEIVGAINRWTEAPSVEDITYGASVVANKGAAEHGGETTTVKYQTAEGVDLDSAPTNAGAYKAIFTIAATDDYEGLTATVDFTINKADYDMNGASWNYTDAFTYDGTAKTVEVTGLPTGVTVAEYAGNTGTNASDYTASVSFAYDETNYNVPILADLNWKINKATYDMISASWDYTDAFTYDGTAKTVEVMGLPTGVTVAEYAGNTGTNASDYTASVTFTYDEANYNTPILADLNWKINKATYDMSGVAFDNATGHVRRPDAQPRDHGHTARRRDRNIRGQR